MLAVGSMEGVGGHPKAPAWYTESQGLLNRLSQLVLGTFLWVNQGHMCDLFYLESPGSHPVTRDPFGGQKTLS